MKKPKQQVLSRFFTPKPQSPPKSTPQNSPPPPSPPRPKPSPKISTTIPFSPSSTISKRSNPNPQIPPPSKKPKSFTPLEHQFLGLKSQHPDVLLMVEVGYRYRFFGEDAEAAARVLGIVAHADHSFLTASVPTFRLHFHVRRLVGAGYKVGVVKQTETAAIKAGGSNRAGPFLRGLSALYTKSTIEAGEEMGGGRGEGMGASDGNYLLCVVEKEVVEGCFDVRIGVVGVEVSTGEVLHGEFNDDAMRSGLDAVVLSLSPAEILIGDPISASTEKVYKLVVNASYASYIS